MKCELFKIRLIAPKAFGEYLVVPTTDLKTVAPKGPGYAKSTVKPRIGAEPKICRYPTMLGTESPQTGIVVSAKLKPRPGAESTESFPHASINSSRLVEARFLSCDPKMLSCSAISKLISKKTYHLQPTFKISRKRLYWCSIGLPF